jgi:acyl-coenzyme A synthetase/AMP-(fatty) acid ligase
MHLMWLDDKRKQKITYSDLIKDLNNTTTFHEYIYELNPYSVYKKIIHAMLLGESVTLLDSTFSETEIISLGIDLDVMMDSRSTKQLDIKSHKQLMTDIKPNFSLSLFTSGTTGAPKIITHSLDTLIRNVRTDERFNDNVWAFAYNPTHIAGLQVFYQAFYNKNPMLYMFEESTDNIERLFAEYKITHISATPTFYRTKILPFKGPVNTVQRVTFGGEKIDSIAEERLKSIFPYAQYRNIYASTEAGSLFTTSGEFFTISQRHESVVKILNDELFIHESLLGKSEHLELVDGWYRTGDIVKQESPYRFKFISRKTETINIGGYKVSPYEIEEAILLTNLVQNVRVLSKKSRVIGNILIAEIEKKSDVAEIELETKIRDELSTRLQKWKIPRIYRFVDKIKETRTGKKMRT